MRVGVLRTRKRVRLKQLYTCDNIIYNFLIFFPFHPSPHLLNYLIRLTL